MGVRIRVRVKKPLLRSKVFGFPVLAWGSLRPVFLRLGEEGFVRGLSQPNLNNKACTGIYREVPKSKLPTSKVFTDALIDSIVVLTCNSVQPNRVETRQTFVGSPAWRRG